MTEELYPFRQIEPKWQKYWEDIELFSMSCDSPKPKFYCLMMFPYPSGTLHVGHGRNYIIGDALARYLIMRGYNVLAPMGWDAFGLPAENAAIKENIHPRIYTFRNIEVMKKQFRRWGIGYDWDREVTSCKPDYYRWTQWLFLKLYERGLAYKKKGAVNWCPSCQTVLANEQVVAGTCERCETVVESRDLEQWYFKITDYAQRLLDDLELLGRWPERVKTMQRNWIGRSEGVNIDFQVKETGDILTCFTTRPDTIFGVTFFLLAPEHPDIPRYVRGRPEENAVLEFVKRIRTQSLTRRGDISVEKEGVFTGLHVINPANEQLVPLWVANYAVMEYGTGAVMGVPAHDQRDFEFARKYNIPVKLVIQPGGLDESVMTEAYIGEGIQVNSGKFDGLPSVRAIHEITEWLRSRGKGRPSVAYRLRDWLISRQRYWGAPIPIIYCEKCGTLPVPEDNLPVLLPDDVQFKPTGQSPLADHPEFLNTKCHRCNGPAKRESDTMDTFVCSSWYFLRYLSPKNDKVAFESDIVNKWLPVDQYIGGIEHAILHLMYARFITKVLYDCGLVNFKEPFENLFTQGMICKQTNWCPNCRKHHPDDMVEAGRCKVCASNISFRLEKMSKSKGNVVDPGILAEKYGADTQRLYTLFLGPPEKDAEWSDRGVVGAYRFLGRLWDAVNKYAPYVRNVKGEVVQHELMALPQEVRDLWRKSHQTIRRVTRSMETNFHFNTAISAVMELLNKVREVASVILGQVPAHEPYGATEEVKQNVEEQNGFKQESDFHVSGFERQGSSLQASVSSSRGGIRVLRHALENTVLLLSPFVPHISEELWCVLGHKPSIFHQPWPSFDPEAAKEEEIKIVIQVDGKVRSHIYVEPSIQEEELEALVLSNEKVKAFIAGRGITKVVVVPGRLVNVVTGK